MKNTSLKYVEIEHTELKDEGGEPLRSRIIESALAVWLGKGWKLREKVVEGAAAGMVPVDPSPPAPVLTPEAEAEKARLDAEAAEKAAAEQAQAQLDAQRGGRPGR